MTTAVQNSPVSPDLLAAVNGASGKSASASTASEAEDRFMKLLVTQMQNQDPLNPLDNAQVTSQLAQLSTVSGIDKMNQTLETLSGNYQSSQSIEAVGMIGKSVLLAGNGITLKDGSAAFGVNLTTSADSVKVNIQDASGRLVRSVDLGSQASGSHAFVWDGKTDDGAAAAAGQYSFKVSATSAGKPVTVDALAFGQVESVTRDSQSVKLNVSGVGSVDLDQVNQIF